MAEYIFKMEEEEEEEEEEMQGNETSGAELKQLHEEYQPDPDPGKQSPSIEENSSHYRKRRVKDWIDGLALEISSLNISSKPSSSIAHRIQQPVHASVAVDDNNNSGNNEFLKLQEALELCCNISSKPCSSIANRIQEPVHASVAVDDNNNSEDNEFLKLQEDLELYSLNISSKPSSSIAYRIQQPVQAFVAVEVNEFLNLQEANNIFMAAYKEIMEMAFEAKTWVVGTPALGSIEEFLPMFRSSPPSGMRVECSITSAIVPVAPESLVSIMMDVDKWASLLSHIVHRGSSHALTGILRQLSAYTTADNMKMVDAEFQLPTPFVPTRKLCFLRFQKQIIPYVWAIIDVSVDYFHHTSSDSTCELKCRRRPSGVIIRRHDENSEVIWIENMEVHDCLAQDNIYSNIVNSNLGFCAKRWVCTLSQKLKRSKGRYINLKMQMDQEVHATLLKLTDCMEKVYMEFVNEAPDESKWVLLSDQGARVLMDIRVNHVHTLGLKNYIALTSFLVQAEPLSVFQYLVKKNLELQWPSLLNLEDLEELIKLATEDDSYCITIHKKVVLNESRKCYEYMLQEAWRDEFCSLIISSSMTQSAVADLLLYGRQRKDFLKPSGFAIMPNGPGGLQSDTSLVTIVMQQELNVPETGQAIEAMSNLISSIRKEINDAVTS